MEWVEVTGRSVAEAKDKALDYLGVDEALAEFEVLEEPRIGLFRRVKGEARVRARIKPTHPRPKAERRDRRRGRARPGGRDEGSGVEDRPAGTEGDRGAGGDRAKGAERPVRADRDRERRPRTSRPARGEGGRSADAGAAPDAVEGVGPRAATGRRRRPDAGRDAELAPSDRPAGSTVDDASHGVEGRGPVAVTPASGSDPGPQSAPDEPDPREEALSAMSDEDRNEAATDDGRQTEHAVDFLTGLVDAFGLPATVTSASVDELYDEVRVEGADLGLLIGQRAATLDAVQELSRVVAQRRSGGRGESRLRVDIGGYRQRRREALERFAIKLAEEVKASGVVKALEPMSSADRKVVHDIVGTLEGVSTLSEGEDPRRRVVIVPAE